MIRKGRGIAKRLWLLLAWAAGFRLYESSLSAMQ